MHYNRIYKTTQCSVHTRTEQGVEHFLDANQRNNEFKKVHFNHCTYLIVNIFVSILAQSKIKWCHICVIIYNKINLDLKHLNGLTLKKWDTAFQIITEKT